MCGGMTYKYPNPKTRQIEARRVFFPQPHAQIPIIGDGGTVYLHQWGRRDKQEDSDSDVPITGWARGDKLESAYWQHYHPELVLIPALRFSEKGKLPKSRWFDMPEDTFLKGLKIQRKDKTFVYLVTHSALGELEKIHPRMPLLVNAQQEPVLLEITPESEQDQLKFEF
jgi:putative SOS response-associated peptidase YedK